jgi:DedD protein
MGLLSSLKGQSGAGSERAAATEADPVQAARARSRRRLIGAAVLLGLGVIGFPILFETQPRPVQVDLPVDIPRKEGAPSLPLPPPRVASAAPATPRVASGVITERAPEPKREAAAPAAKTPEAAPQPKPAEAPRSAVTAKASPPPVPVDDGARAKALLEGKPPAAAAPAATVAEAKPKAPESSSKTAAAASAPADKPELATGRFVVQVAAYAEMNSARDMRQRVEKLGLKSYTQVVEIDGATRIRVRVGPFTSRDEADKAVATLKAAGLPAAVLSL